MDREALLRELRDCVGRPVRWMPPDLPLGDFDGSERTIEVFHVAAGEQMPLRRVLRPFRARLDAELGGPVVFIFHTPAESMRHYAEFLDAEIRRGPDLTSPETAASLGIRRLDLEPLVHEDVARGEAKPQRRVA